MQESGDLGLIHRALGKGISLGNPAPVRNQNFGWKDEDPGWQTEQRRVHRWQIVGFLMSTKG